MTALDRIIERLTSSDDTAESWVEFARDLQAPITCHPPAIEFSRRWAGKADIMEIAALEGFAKEIDVMTRSLRHGDRCLLLERDGRIGAFAWVAFQDYRLAIWRTLHLPAGVAYLVYIFVRPEFRRSGVGSYLLGCLMQHLRNMGYTRLISGMYADWRPSIDLHRKAGFQPSKKFIKRKLLRIIPVPPKEMEVET